MGGLRTVRRGEGPADGARDRLAGAAHDGRLGHGQPRQAQRPAGPAGQQRDGGDGDRRVRRAQGQGQRRGGDEVPGRGARLGGAAQLGAVGLQQVVGLGDRARHDVGAERRGHLPGLGDVLVPFGRRQRLGAEPAVRLEEHHDLGHVHPRQQVRIVGGVRPAVGCRALDAFVDGAHRVDRLLGVVDGPERRDGEEVAGAGQPPPRVAAEAGVGVDAGHRQRVQRLQQQCGESADEHRRIAVDARDRAAELEPPLGIRAAEALASLGAIRAGDALEDGATDRSAHAVDQRVEGTGRHGRQSANAAQPPGPHPDQPSGPQPKIPPTPLLDRPT